MNNILKYFFVISFFLFLPLMASAHQPNFSEFKKEIEVSNPEISQAFYGFLNNSLVVYSLNLDKPIELYVGILTPDILDAKNNLSVAIKNEAGDVVVYLNKDNDFVWERWYEEFAGDWYWKGPEFKSQIEAGNYTIEIQNIDNQGEYVLAVGEIESFPLNNFPKMISELYKIKTQFFKKPGYSIFQNKIGGFFGIVVLVIVVIIFALVKIIKKIRI